MIRYNEFEFPQINYGDLYVSEIRIGNRLIWERVVFSNFFGSDGKYLLSKDGLIFNAKKE